MGHSSAHQSQLWVASHQHWQRAQSLQQKEAAPARYRELLLQDRSPPCLSLTVSVWLRLEANLQRLTRESDTGTRISAALVRASRVASFLFHFVASNNRSHQA